MRTVCLQSLVAISLLATPAIAAQRNFPAQDFDRVRLVGSPDVAVTIGPKFAVSATGDQQALNGLEIVVENRELVIRTQKGVNLAAMDDVDVMVSMPAITAAVLTGSGDIEVRNVEGKNFTGQVTGSGDLDLKQVKVDELTLSVAGSGDISADAGHCGKASYQVRGSGDIDADDVRCDTVAATVNGSGDIEAYASKSAQANVTGSGNITVRGGATCSRSVKGGGTVNCS